VTVVFCDVVGSTALGESVDPEALRGLLARYFERMKAIVERHGGTVEKFIGDAVMAVFGVPVAHEDDALRAVRATGEMREAVPELGIRARVGVMTGEVVTGTEERLATGDAVNVAARLEQAAEPGEVLIGGSTLALVRDAVDVEPLVPLVLKGTAEPVLAYRLVRVHEAPERQHGARFVGRERELALIRDAFQRAERERHCELVTIAGEAGVGKSRLAAEALASVEARVVRGRCLPYGEGITYWPVVEVLKQLGVMPPEEAAVEAIRALLGETDARTSAEEIAWAFRKTLEHAAHERPLVVLFDDIQWGEGAFHDLIEHVALLSSDAPVLLVCLARPEHSERRPSWPVALRLGPLGEDDVQRLIPAWVSHGLRERIMRAAGGNPLFVGEMLAIADPADSEPVVPPTLQALLAARLDLLEPRERRVLQRGAVEGEIFHRGAVQALAPDEPQLTPHLAALVRKGLVRPDMAQIAGEDGFRFQHLLIRDAAYAALPKTERAELHERLAAWVDQHGSALVELDEILGYHLEQAYRYRADLAPLTDEQLQLAARAAERLAAAGRRASARADTVAADNLLSRAASLLPDTSPAKLEVLTDLGEVLRETGDFERAETVLTQAIAAAAELGNRAVDAHARLIRQRLRMQVDPEATPDDLIETAEEAISLFEELGDQRRLAKAWFNLAWAPWVKGSVAQAERALERAIDVARRAGDERTEAQSVNLYLGASVYGPTPVAEAVRRCEELLARPLQQWRVAAAAYRALAGLRAMEGRFDEARRMARQDRAILEDLGLNVAAGMAAEAYGLVEILAGDHAAAERELRAGFEALEEIGEISILANLAAALAQVLYSQKRDADALRFSEISEQASAHDDVVPQVQWRAVRAKLLARIGHPHEAERLARVAVMRAERTPDLLLLRGDAHLDLAEVLVATDQQPAAAPPIETALKLYKRKGNVVSASVARARLAERQRDTESSPLRPQSS
jgi:class 3 adenylate cyclase/tetratricopeptide (TPR) repeat protein